ncbi:MAG: hypothetical protein ACOCRD_02860 [Halorubrum sp.]
MDERRGADASSTGESEDGENTEPSGLRDRTKTAVSEAVGVVVDAVLDAV